MRTEPPPPPPLDLRAVAAALRTVSRRVGPCVGSFDDEARLGKGRFGEVFKAYHPRLDCQVALKLLSAENPDEERYRLREPRAVASLGSHPHVHPVYDCGLDGKQLFIVMPLANGSLADLIDQEGPRLPTGAALEIARQIAEGLVATHARGLVHCDLKPTNVLYAWSQDTERRQRWFRLADFGLARGMGDPTGHAGTPDYMSPEVWQRRADERADLWAAGVVLYESVAGRRPFQGDDTEALKRAILNGERRDLRQECPDIPEVVRELVERALQRSLGRRFPSASAWRDAIEYAQRQFPVEQPVLSQLALLQFLAEARNPDPAFGLSIRTVPRSNTPRRVQDELRFRVEVEEDCFLTLLNVGTSGRLTVLYPNAFTKDKRLRRDEPRWLPEANDGFCFILDGPSGTELIKAIASRTPLDLGELTRRTGDSINSFPPGFRSRDVKVLAARERLENLPRSQWAEASLRIDVRD